MNPFEKIMERLEEDEKHTFDGCINKRYVKQIVQEVAEEYNNGWIPVSERLPENEDYVLCWYEYRIMQGTRKGEMNQTYGIGYYLQVFKKWCGEPSVGVDCKVIAWQPLPEPPKESETDE